MCTLISVVKCRIRSFLSIGHAHGDLCKHLGIDSSTDLDPEVVDIGVNTI